MAKRIALITGGMGGLGESISTKMHDADFNVVVTHSPSNKNAAAWVADYKGKGYNFIATYRSSCRVNVGPSLHVLATVDGDIGSGDKGRFV
jgi:NAD(P)-dependent dehydrogenase (short-subunit alcohol dehydrogenase family)